MAMVDFYHYTSEDAVDQIILSDQIIQSAEGGPHAHFGTGVYGTALPPSTGKRAIAMNNWTQGWKGRERRGRVDYVFKIRIPRSHVEEYTTGSRQLYLHKGPIKLSHYEWELFEV